MSEQRCAVCHANLEGSMTRCPSCGALVPESAAPSLSDDPYSDEIPYGEHGYVPFIDAKPAAEPPASSSPPPAQPTLSADPPTVRASLSADPPTVRANSQPYPYPYPYSTVGAAYQQPPPVASAEPVPPAAPKSPPRAFTPLKTTLFVILALLLLIEGTVLAVYQIAFHPAQLDVQATAIAQDVLSQQAQNAAASHAEATATVNAMTGSELYAWATKGTPVIDDPLTAIGSSPWYDHTSTNLDCNFSGGAYHVRAPVADNVYCGATNAIFRDMAFQVQTTIVKGTDGGIIFRLSNAGSYYFTIGANGGYALGKIQNSQITYLKQGLTTATIRGFNQPNIVTVIALGSHIYFYINKQPLGVVTDTSLTSGFIAFFGDSANTAIDIAFNNVKVWEL